MWDGRGRGKRKARRGRADGPRILFVGPLPPPRNGMTGVTETLLHSPLADEAELVHVDTSDHRSISNVGRVDLTNVLVAIRSGFAFLVRLLPSRPELVYVPVARNRVGLLRDCLFLLPARCARVPVVVHFHSRAFCDYWENESGWMRWLIRVAFGPRAHGIALAQSLCDGFEPLIPRRRVHAVPNGVPDIGPGVPCGRRERTVLHISTMRGEKGLFDVLEIARRVRSRLPDARFVLAGSWYSAAERARAEEFVREHSLGDRVRFAGHVEGEEKAALLRSAALMLLPSRYEGQPLVVLEALAAGTPVVATGVGAVPETARDWKEGLLAPVGDVEALTERVVRLLGEPGLREELGAAARRRYEELYTPFAFGSRLAAALRAVAAAEEEAAAGAKARA